MSKKEDLLVDARKAFERAREYWADNHRNAEADFRFVRLGEQWPEKIKKQREDEGRPVETFNKLLPFFRQVVNDARMNKPGIKVHPQDSGADPAVADIFQGLIRNIEVVSDADVACDTAIECAADRGMGYWRINTRYTSDDTFDQDIVIERVTNPLTIYGDPNSQAADSSDWNEAWVITSMTKDEFKAEYPDAEMTDWDTDFKDAPDGMGVDGENVTICEWWVREKVKRQIVALQDGSIVDVKDLAKLGPVATIGQPREVESHKVKQRCLTAAEVLKEVEWAGKYIPIVPVYGDEAVDEKGKRHFISLIRPAIGSQRMYNYMRNTEIEVEALQPKVPFIGEQGSFDCDPNWDNVNDQSIATLEYAKGSPRPERQMPPQGSQAALQGALSASDDMKGIIGIYDAGLGQKSNETSGVAIDSRKRESDVATFHFVDNLQRAIRHSGRILIDLIPKVYSTERIVRVLGEDMQAQNATIAPTGQPVTEVEQPDGSIMRIYDLTVGKYDLTVSAGPNFSTRREEMAEYLSDIMGRSPEVTPILLPRLVKHMDFPDADEIAEELQAINPANQQQLPPEVQEQMGQMQQAAEQGQQMVGELQQQVAQLQMQLKDKSQDAQLKARQLELDAFRAQTERATAIANMRKPTQPPRASSAA